MNKKNNRKGFTIVELVIVIAVIAILATVLVPTFGNVIADAKNTALVQEIKNAHTQFAIEYAKDGVDTDDVVILYNEKYYTFADGQLVLNDEGVPAVATPVAGDVYYDAAEGELTHIHGAWTNENKCGTEGCTETKPAEG